MLPLALLTYSTKPRGSVVHAGYLAEALTRRGVDVTLYALSKTGDEFYRTLECPIELLDAAPAPIGDEQLIRQRICEMADGLARCGLRRAIYHSEDCLAANGLVRVRPLIAPRAVVRTVHHVDHFSNAYLAECQRRSVASADRVLVVSSSTGRELRSEFGRVAGVISNGVVPGRFERREPLREDALRSRLGIEPSSLVVLSVGGIEPRKNTLRSLEAVARVQAAFPDLYWLIVGGASIWDHDAQTQAFEKRLSQLPSTLRARVKRLGQVSESELTLLYQLSDVLLCASEKEGFGLCALEALAAGSAVVVSDREPFTEWLEPEAACFVDPYSESSIAEGLLRVVSDPALRARRARAGRGIVERFTWDRVAEAHMAEYERLSHGRPSNWFRPEN